VILVVFSTVWSVLTICCICLTISSFDIATVTWILPVCRSPAFQHIADESGSSAAGVSVLLTNLTELQEVQELTSVFERRVSLSGRNRRRPSILRGPREIGTPNAGTVLGAGHELEDL
jgi:hypothetical protein